MRFENANQNDFLGVWRYSVKLVHQLTNPETDTWRSKQEYLAVDTIEGFLKVRAEGPWLRKGNVIYLKTLSDVFHLRLFFEPDIDLIEQALPSQP